MRCTSLSVLGLAALFALVVAGPAHAEPSAPVPAAPESPDVAVARQDFIRGAEFANRAQWAEALAARSSESAKLRAHSGHDLQHRGACQRAMGSYTLARETLRQALAGQRRRRRKLSSPEMLVTDARGFVAEIDRLLSTVTVTLVPADSRIAVDGRPLSVRKAAPGDGLPTLVAGVLPPGTGTSPPSSTFRTILNPGTRVFTLSRQGFADSIVTRTCAPGSSTDMKLELDRLPATLHIASSPDHAAVTLDGVDVGATPVDITRPAGSYHVMIRARGVVPYDTQVVAHPGEELSLSPTLAIEKVPLTQKWWFWSAVGAVIAGAAAGSYGIVRSQAPAPAATPPTGGTLGWTVTLH